MLGASDIDRNERIKSLLAQLKNSRGYQSKAIEADRANELSSDLGYNFEKIGRAFSNERPNRADYKSEADNLGRAKAITGGLKEDLAGTYEEALHDPTSAISGASRGIYGDVSGLPAEDLAGASAMQLESLTGPLKVKSSLANAEMLGKINAGKLGMAAKEEERKNKELGLKEQELGLKRSESESKVGKVQADLADQSDPNTPKAKALQDIYLNALKKAGAEIDPAYVRQLPAASVKELLDSHFKIESSKYGVDESTRRAKELLDKKLADEQLARDAMAAQKEKERLFQGQKAKEGLLSQKQLKEMGITSAEGIAEANRKNALKLKEMEIAGRLKQEGMKAGSKSGKTGGLTQDQFDRQRIKFAEELKPYVQSQNKINQINQVLARNGTTLESYTPKHNLPGVSFPGIGRVGLGQDYGELQSAIQDLLNQKIYDSSGKAVNTGEMERIQQAFNAGRFNSESQLIDAVRRYKKEIESLQKNMISSYNPDVVSSFSEQGGSFPSYRKLKPTLNAANLDAGQRAQLLLQARQYMKSGDPVKIEKAKAVIKKLGGK